MAEKLENIGACVFDAYGTLFDVAGAANFGFKVNWVNSFGQATERLPGEPANEIKSLDELPVILGL